MLTYAKLALILLQVANKLLNAWHDAQQFDAGVDAEIAHTSASILAKTKVGKETMQQVMGLTDAQVDEALKQLEPAVGSG